MTSTPTSDPDGGGVGTIDRSHLLLVGAGPGLGMAVARRFAVGGYRVSLVARVATGCTTSRAACPTPAPRSARSWRTQATLRAWVPG
jgi:hypothetical protein